MEKNFSLPKLSKCETFIYFSYWNADKWKFERHKKHISRKIPPEKRRKEIARLLDYWLNELKNGYNPYVEIKEIAENLQMNTLANTVQKTCNSRTEFLRRKSRLTYQSKVDYFIRWTELKGINKTLVADFTREQAEDFLRWMKKDKRFFFLSG